MLNEWGKTYVSLTLLHWSIIQAKFFLVAKVTLESQMSVHHQKPSDPKYQIYLTYISDLSYSYDYQVDQFCKIAQNYQLKFCEVSLTKI